MKKTLFISVFIAILVSSIYIIFSPGGLKSDAYEYDALSNSILTGHYDIYGSPSMLREPGYPAFRATMKALGENNTAILWTQAILYGLSVLLIGLAVFKIDERAGSWGALGAALSYGLAYYPSTHLSETLTAFLLSLAGFLTITAINDPRLKFFISAGLVYGLLLLTRAPFLLVPLFCAMALYLHYKKTGLLSSKKILLRVAVLILSTLAVVTPWVIRNYKEFNLPNISGRSGAILYARAWKTDASWQSLGESYLSVFMGRGLLFSFLPNANPVFQEQWGDWQRDPEQIKSWGDDPVTIDQNRERAAVELIFKDFNHFAKYAVWTGVDELRLFALPNPVFPARGSPIEGTYGPLAKESGLSAVQVLALVTAHLLQLIWFVSLAVSLLYGFKKYGYKFIPGIFMLSLALPLAAVDDTARFSMPIQPWLLAGIFIVVCPWLLRSYKRFRICSPTTLDK